MTEVPRLEARLTWLATICNCSALGFLGTILGLIEVFRVLQVNGPFADVSMLSGGVWQALIAAAMGLALLCRTAYNYLVERMNSIVLIWKKRLLISLGFFESTIQKTPNE